MAFIHLFSYRAIMCGDVWLMHDVHHAIHHASCHEQHAIHVTFVVIVLMPSAPSPHISHFLIPWQSKWPHLKMASCWTFSNINLFPHFAYVVTNLVLPKLVEKIKQLYILPTLVECHSTTASFDMWCQKLDMIFLHWWFIF
jgi:hypothetical protein